MQILGKKLRETRLAQNLSQTELCRGICTQATISNIEAKNHCDSLDIFVQLCARLNTDVNEFLISSKEQELQGFLDKIEGLCDKSQYKKAFQLIKKYSNDLPQENGLLLDKFYYYYGLTSLLVAKNYEDASYYLYRGAELKENRNIYNILSLNFIGMMYHLTDQEGKAKVYHDKSVKMLLDYKQKLPKAAYEIFYNSARFYSQIGEYKQSINLCKKGIQLNKENETSFYLDKLYYELALNKETVGENAVIDYLTAYTLAQHKEDQAHLNIIKKKMTEQEIELDLNFLAS